MDGEAAEAVCELFERHGGGAVVEILVRDEDRGRRLPQQRHRVLTYLPVDDAEGRLKVEVGLWHLGMIYPIPEAAIRRLAEANWAEAWKERYRPLRIPTDLGASQPGPFDPPSFVILPSWLEPAAIQPPLEEGEVLLRLDPGMAFGTGLHPSTQLCLAALARHMRPGARVLDVGTGSGILAIAAAKIGAGQVLGVDIDPRAAQVAAANAELNGAEGEFRAGELGQEGLRPIAAPDGDGASLAVVPLGEPFDLVLANILAPTLIALAPTLAAHLAPGGVLVLSGILDEQADGVAAAYEALGLREVERCLEGDWVGLVLGSASGR